MAPMLLWCDRPALVGFEYFESECLEFATVEWAQLGGGDVARAKTLQLVAQTVSVPDLLIVQSYVQWQKSSQKLYASPGRP